MILGSLNIVDNIYLNGYFKGFVNTSGEVGVDIKIEKLMNRINKIVEKNFNFDFVFVFD